MGGVNTNPKSFTPGKETWYLLYRTLGGPESRSERVNKISPATGIQSQDLLTHSIVAISTELSWPTRQNWYMHILVMSPNIYIYIHINPCCWKLHYSIQTWRVPVVFYATILDNQCTQLLCERVRKWRVLKIAKVWPQRYSGCSFVVCWFLYSTERSLDTNLCVGLVRLGGGTTSFPLHWVTK